MKVETKIVGGRPIVKVRPAKKGARGIALVRLRELKGRLGRGLDNDQIIVRATKSHLILLQPVTVDRDFGGKPRRKHWAKKQATLAELFSAISTGFLEFKGTLELGIRDPEAKEFESRLELID